MNSRTLAGLLAALAVLVALAIAVSVSQRPAATSGGPFLPGLKAAINDVGKVVVRAGGDKTVATLERTADGWTVAERDGYPADVGRIRKNLIALADATLLEEKTSNPEMYGRLKVDDIEKDTAAGLRLDISAGDKTTSVIIGTTGVGGGDRAYARRAGEPTSWLISGSFDTARDTAEWLDRVIVDIPPGRVHAVTISHPGGARLAIDKARPGETDFQVSGVSAGRQLSFPGVANAIGAGLGDLRLDTVEPAAGFAPGDVKPVVARFETFDGLVVEVQTYRLPAGLRLRLSASADKALADRFAPPATPEAGKDAEAAPAVPPKPFAEVQAEAEALQARFGRWVYAVPEFKSEQLTRRMDDLLAPKDAS